MKRIAGTVATALAGAALVLGVAPAQADTVYRDGSVYARVGDSSVELGNGLVVRRWTRAPFQTAEISDRRGIGRLWSGGSPDFVLTFGPLELRSNSFVVDSAGAEKLPRGGLRLTMHLTLAGLPAGMPAGLEVTRTAESYHGVAGFRTHADRGLLPRPARALAGASRRARTRRAGRADRAVVPGGRGLA